MLDPQKIRDEISKAARERWNQLNEVSMQGIVAAECADIAMRILDAHGAFEQPQDERDVCTCGEPRKVCELRTEVDQMGAALNSAYRERAHLVALLAAVYPSHIGRTDPAAPDWPVVTLQTPAGQAAWHINTADEDLFQHVEHNPEHAFEYDGHSTEEKYARIRTLTAELATAEMGPHDVMAMPTAEQPQDGVAPYRPLLDDEEFIDILQGGSFYAEVTAFRRLAATIGVEQTYRKWTKLQRRARTDAGRPLNEQPQDERDGDVRAVAALAAADNDDELDRAVSDLIARFADRIEALEARDAKGGGEQ